MTRRHGASGDDRGRSNGAGCDDAGCLPDLHNGSRDSIPILGICRHRLDGRCRYSAHRFCSVGSESGEGGPARPGRDDLLAARLFFIFGYAVGSSTFRHRRAAMVSRSPAVAGLTPAAMLGAYLPWAVGTNRRPPLFSPAFLYASIPGPVRKPARIVLAFLIIVPAGFVMIAAHDAILRFLPPLIVGRLEGDPQDRRVLFEGLDLWAR